MYRPKKRKIVRRVSAASVVAVVAAVGLGITFINQSDAVSVTGKIAVQEVGAAAHASTTASAKSAKYHLTTSGRHDTDSTASSDN
jgi:hypothetical protein